MIIVETARNLKWVDAENTKFDCLVKFQHSAEEQPFTCLQSETYEHTTDLWNRATSGEFGTIAEFVPYVEETQDPNLPTLPTNQNIPRVVL